MTLSHNEKGLIVCIRRIKEHWQRHGSPSDLSYSIELASGFADQVEKEERADWVDVDEGR